jgi:hypothetical protein
MCSLAWAGLSDNPRSHRSFSRVLLSSEPIMKALRELNFTQPSKIQEKALPMLLRNPYVFPGGLRELRMFFCSSGILSLARSLQAEWQA